MCCGALLCLSSPVMAQSGDKQKMQEVSDQAMVAFQNNEFGKAAQGFEDAYKIYPESVLLKNATVAWYSASECGNAEDSALRYLEQTEKEEAQLGKDRQDVKTVIARCRLRIATIAFNGDDIEGAKKTLKGIELYAKEDKEAEALIELRDKIEVRQKELAAQNKDKDDGQTTGGGQITPPVVPSNEPPPGLLYTGASLTGVGGLGLLLTYLVVTKPGQGAEKIYYEDIKCDNRNQSAECSSAADDIDKAYRNGIIFYTTSGVVAATGVSLMTVYFVKKNKAKEEQKVFLLPDVSPDRAGASVLIRF